MPKRKREDDYGSADAVLSVKQRRVQLKLTGHVAKLRHAFKVAKGFERQKLGRRSKNAAAGKIDKTLDQIEAEINALKALDIGACASHHLHKTLCKSKAVSEHHDLPPEVKAPSRLPSDTATLNVSARLCNANQVQSAMNAAISDIYRALGLDDKTAKSLKKGRLRANDLAEDQDESVREEHMLNAGSRKQKPPSAQTSDSDNLEEDGEIDEDSLDDFDDRLASSIDEGDGGVMVDHLERQLAREGMKRQPIKAETKKYDVAADLYLSEDDAAHSSSSPEPSKAPVTKRPDFLPSLTMGGYVSGSGSDIEDLDVAPKKNRRGQRARQKIWEQKHGAKAKHLQRQQRNAGFDPKRGAVDGSERRGPGGHQKRMGRANSDYNTGGDRRAGVSDRTKDQNRDPDPEKPMHPSWEAARRAKEKRAEPVAFLGKKVTFD